MDKEDSEVNVRFINQLGQFEIEVEVVLGVLKSFKEDRPLRHDGIYPMLLR